jgi:hypothetical protein
LKVADQDEGFEHPGLPRELLQIREGSLKAFVVAGPVRLRIVAADAHDTPVIMMACPEIRNSRRCAIVHSADPVSSDSSDTVLRTFTNPHVWVQCKRLHFEFPYSILDEDRNAKHRTAHSPLTAPPAIPQQ